MQICAFVSHRLASDENPYRARPLRTCSVADLHYRSLLLNIVDFLNEQLEHRFGGLLPASQTQSA